MSNFGLFTNNWDLVPGINVGQIFSGIADPNVDVIPGVSSPIHSYPNGVPGALPQSVVNSTPKKSPGNATNTSGAYTGGSVLGSSTSTTPAYDPADMAYLDDQEARLRGQMGSADATLNNGLTQLQDSYNKEVSGANSQRSRALEDFAVKREDTTRAKDTALNKVGENARTLGDSLRRRIGMASGSGSSAYQITAPGAVARDASRNRTNVQENYGTNFRNLGMAEDRAKVDFDNLLGDLEAQRKTRESDFRSGVLDRKNQIEGSLAEIARQRALLRGGGYDQVRSAMAPHAGAIDSRQAEIDGLFNRFRTPYNVKAVEVQAPTLRDYLTDRANIGTGQAEGGPVDPLSPYSQMLKRQAEDEEELQLA